MGSAWTCTLVNAERGEKPFNGQIIVSPQKADEFKIQSKPIIR